MIDDPRLRRPGEVVRSRLLTLLDRRWDRTVTTIVAPAGFGKSTAVTQAMRADRLAPRGIEGRISCRWGCEDAVRLVTSAAAALGAQLPPRGSPLARFVAAVGSQAPLRVCLVIDDVETLHHSGIQLLGELLDALPGNLRLVLVGRELPPVGLARLRAAGELLEVTDEDLRFDATEIADLADRLGTTAPDEHLGGWPAVIRLSLAAPGRAADDYLWEEVINRLAPDHRRALQALCALGSATVAEVEQVSGLTLDVDDFCARVPLVTRDGSTLVAHDLWQPFLPDLGGEGALPQSTLAVRAGAVVARRGDVVASGQLAIRLGDHVALRRAAVDLVYARLGSPPVEIAESWLAAADPDTAASPSMQLLRCALAHSRVATEPPSSEIDAVLEALDGDEGARPQDPVIGLGFAVLVAYETGDLGRILELSLRAREVVPERTDPILDQLGDAVSAASLMFQGDIGGALAELDKPRPSLPAGLRAPTLVRLHWHLLLLAGRAADAAAVAAPIDGAPVAEDRPLRSVARWLDGDPDAFDLEAEDLGPTRYVDIPERDQFDFAGFIAPLTASLPGTDPVDVACGILTSSAFAVEVGPDAALVAVGLAAHRIVHHDDEGAAAELSRFLARGSVDGLTDAHLRRSLGIPYVCSPELRDAWDAADLGPSQRAARQVARALVDARDRRCPTEAPGLLPSIVTMLPFPWAVELAALAAAGGRAWGTELGVELADRFGDEVLGELRRLETGSPGDARTGARLVVQALPTRPPTTLSIDVLGSMALHRGAETVMPPELRRVRVRELLSVLVAERSVSRERAIELIWPDQEPSKGRANLRVTLAHLQSALEPERPRDLPPYYVRATTAHLSLTPSPDLVVDLWDVERLLAEADDAASAGDTATRTACLSAAVGRWRGRALPDLDGVAELSPVVEHVERRLVAATLTLGEIELVGDAALRASSRAERVLAADPYDERAHRLAIAARIQAGDRTATTVAIDRMREALGDLGVGPDERTQVLLRQADHAQRALV